MFSSSELSEIMSKQAFLADISNVRQSLVNSRLRQPVMLLSGSESRLAHFCEAVLASAPDWDKNSRIVPCRIAGEIMEVLADKSAELEIKSLRRIRAALLYELADLTALAASVLRESDLSEFLLSFFRRTGAFSKLNGFDETADVSLPTMSFGELALTDDALQFAKGSQYNQEGALDLLSEKSISSAAWKIGQTYNLGLTASELRAFSTLLPERINRSTVSWVSAELVQILRSMAFPTELLPAQKAALDHGLLNHQLPAWGFAAPTGSGKTYLARLLIADILSSNPETKIIYLVPSRALVSEVAFSLTESFNKIPFQVLSLSAQLVDLDENERGDVDEASVVVMTPEKADMLLRLNAEFLKTVSLVVIDEAHHIESGTRGALLELYLWRLKRLLSTQCRYVFLSAVAPNIVEITRWLDPAGNAVVFSQRPTRMRVGIYSLQGKGISARSVINYSDDTTIQVASKRAETTIRRGICELAQFLQPAGPVLIVAKGKKECEKIAMELKGWLKRRNCLSTLKPEDSESDTYLMLDSSLEREMYSDVELRTLIRHRIAYHHAGLPPSVRHGVEEAIRKHLIDYVVATTTLAEGVNFPFSSVVVQSLALREPPEAGRPSRYAPVTPRAFWNIAGRAGRLGFDPEGQVILFEPSLGLDKIGAVIEPYINPDMTSLAPVHSALASALETIQEELGQQHYGMSQLEDIRLPEKMSRRARGAINLVRVGLMHAYATGLVNSPEEILESSFAATFLSDLSLQAAMGVFRSQDKAIKTYLSTENVPSMEKLAELGLSLETLTELRDYIQQMQDWQIENLSILFYGGTLNLDQSRFIVAPVAKRMSELEGPNLGGFLSDVIVQWLSGATFTSIRTEAGFSKRLEDLIAVIYSRIQYLLPWGLWATDWLIEQEARKRSINYDNQVKKLAYLSDAGVPNFDALRLFNFHFERVDATRLSQAYGKAGGLETGVDCLGWVLQQPKERLERIIRGPDSRRIEYKFLDKLDSLRSATPTEGK